MVTGLVKGLELKEYLERWFQGETMEVGLYLAMAKRAEEEGYPEVAALFRKIAWDEASHAAIAAELAGKVGSTKENLEKMIEGEGKAAEMRLKEAEHHDDPAKSYFYTTGKDEECHRKALEAVYAKYFK